MSESAALLASIPELVRSRNAGRLAELRDHPNRDVRKAVRKALHTLKSQGVDVPEGDSKAWSLGSELQAMRGDLRTLATVDARSMPGALRFVMTIPDDDGARLLAGTISPEERILDFQAWRQTDGQRTRMLRDWERSHGDRVLPVDWLGARIRYARDKTIAAGFSVPRALDESLSALGDSSERPAAFVAKVTAEAAPFDPTTIEQLMARQRVDMWPPLCNLDAMLQRAAEIHGDKPQPSDDEGRVALIAEACKGEQTIRDGLAGPIANAFEDLAVHAWLMGDADDARALAEITLQLRTAAEPEALVWAHRVLGYQVASLLRVVTRGGQIPLPNQGGDDHGHDHDHDHGHDHDHDHDHDHGHDHDHDHGHSH
jgi:hypothetical protein